MVGQQNLPSGRLDPRSIGIGQWRAILANDYIPVLTRSPCDKLLPTADDGWPDPVQAKVHPLGADPPGARLLACGYHLLFHATEGPRPGDGDVRPASSVAGPPASSPLSSPANRWAAPAP